MSAVRAPLEEEIGLAQPQPQHRALQHGDKEYIFPEADPGRVLPESVQVDLEAVFAETHAVPQVVTASEAGSTEDGETAKETSSTTTRSKWLRPLRLTLVIVVILAVIGTIVGAVVGTQHNRNRRPGQESPLPRPESPLPGPELPNNPSNGTLPLAGPQQTSACRGGTCSVVSSQIAWSNKRFIFSLSANRSLLCRMGSSGQWESDWINLGGNFTYAPVPVSPSDGQIDVFGVQNDQGLYWRNFTNGTWSQNWTRVEGTWKNPVAVVSRQRNMFNAYSTAPENNLMQEWFYFIGSNSTVYRGVREWSGEYIKGALSIASWDPNRYELFAQGNDNNLHWRSFISPKGLEKWQNLLGSVYSSPVAISSGPERLDVFALGPNGDLCWLGYRSVWQQWKCLDFDKKFRSLPSLIILGFNRVDVIGLATDDHIYQRSLVDLSWSTQWEDLGGPLNGAPVAAKFEANISYIFGVGMDQAMYVSEWNTSGSSWKRKGGWMSLGEELLSNT